MDKADLIAETGRCVACGLCLPHCPTYRKTQSEADSPRGRILLTQAVLQGALPLSERYAEHIDLCLTCRACESVCPNQVNYGRIADEARSLIHEQQGAPLWMRLFAKLIAHRPLLRFGAGLARIAGLLGLRKRLKLPVAGKRYQWLPQYAAPQARGEVCLFIGCVTDAFDAETLAASIFVLNRLGYTVHVPAAQVCCGGLHRQLGDSAGAATLEMRNQGAFAPFANMPLLVAASGCGARLIEYLPQAQDINVFLAGAEGWDQVEIAPLPAKVAVQEPCTLRNVLKAKGVQQALLARIPEAQVIALPGNAQCCGGAGSYMLTQPEMARRLRDDKISAYKTIESDFVATANIGCAMHIGQSLDEAGLPARIVHPVVLLARQMGFKGALPC